MQTYTFSVMYVPIQLPFFTKYFKNIYYASYFFFFPHPSCTWMI